MLCASAFSVGDRLVEVYNMAPNQKNLFTRMISYDIISIGKVWSEQRGGRFHG